MTERGQLIADRLMICIYAGELDNDDQKRIMLEISGTLGLKDLTTFAKQEGISPAAALKRKNDRLIIANHKFVIDND